MLALQPRVEIAVGRVLCPLELLWTYTLGCIVGDHP